MSDHDPQAGTGRYVVIDLDHTGHPGKKRSAVHIQVVVVEQQT